VKKNHRVLVVDDYPGARYRRMRLLLDAGGFDVAEESLGRDAVRRIANEHFDLIVLDLHLPDLSGLDVCRLVKGDPRTAAIPIVAVSAVSDSVEAERLTQAAGAAAFLTDESDGEMFLKTVRGVLGGPAAA
jgi:CheY-like chemotaxis protein